MTVLTNFTSACTSFHLIAWYCIQLDFIFWFCMSLHYILQYCSFDGQAVSCKTSIVMEKWLRGLHLARHSFHDQQKIRQRIILILNYHSFGQIYFFHSCPFHFSFLAFCGIFVYSGNDDKIEWSRTGSSLVVSRKEQECRLFVLSVFFGISFFPSSFFIVREARALVVFVSQSQEATEVLGALNIFQREHFTGRAV